jgi:WD40 repeat protein
MISAVIGDLDIMICAVVRWLIIFSFATLTGCNATMRTSSGNRSEILLTVALSDGQIRTFSRDGDIRTMTVRDFSVLSTTRVTAPGNILVAALTPGGHTLAIGDDQGTIRFFRNERLVRTLSTHGQLISLALSHDGETVAAIDGEQVRIWTNIVQPSERTFPVEAGSLSIALSPDGQSFALGGTRMVPAKPAPSIELRDSATGQILASFGEPRLTVGALAFNPRGTRLVAAGTRKQSVVDPAFVAVYDLNDGAEICSMEDSTPYRIPRSLAFDEVDILSATIRGNLRLYRVEGAVLKAQSR